VEKIDLSSRYRSSSTLVWITTRPMKSVTLGDRHDVKSWILPIEFFETAWNRVLIS
jgi:hypothetical protein